MRTRHILMPLATIALFVTIGAVAILGLRRAEVSRASEFQLYDRWLRDRHLREPPRKSECVIVAITEQDINTWGQYPISDRVMCDLLDRILAGEPKAVGLDIFRDQPVPELKSKTNDRERLIHIFREHPWVVAPIAIGDHPDHFIRAPVELRSPQSAGQIGFVDLSPDRDDVVRHVSLQNRDHDGVMRYSMASQLVQLYVDRQRDRFDVGPDGDPLQRFGATVYRPVAHDGPYLGSISAQRDDVKLFIDFRTPDFERYSVQDVIEGKVPANTFTNKVVLVGLWTRSVKDFILSPLRGELERDFGVRCHARIVDQLIRAANGENNLAQFWSPGREQLLIIGCCLMGGALGWAVRPPWRAFAGASGVLIVALVAIVVVASLYLVARRAFDRNLWIPVIPPAAGFILCTTMVGLYTGVRGRQERNAMMQLISGFVSDDVAKLIWGDRDAIFASGGLRPRRQRATMLFTDLKGFSTIAEQMDAADLMRWLNEYFEGITDLVKDSGGLIMKFNGDQIVAVFGPPRNRTRDEAIVDARNAVTCALTMRQRLRTLNADWARRGKPQAKMRIGIHTGQIVAGSLGSRKRQEWTVIGHTVNIAARLESLKKELMPPDIAADGCRILISDRTARLLDLSIDTRRVGKLELKGIKRRMTVHGVIGWAASSALAAARQAKTAIATQPVIDAKKES